MIPRELVKAKNLEEVLVLLEENAGKAKVIAGGTDFVIQLREKKISPEMIIDISNADELSYIKEAGEYIEIGAGTTFTKIVNSPVIDEAFKGLKEAANHVGSPQIRNRGTVGGNICNASPAADTVPALLALGAIAVLKSKNGVREIELADFYEERGKLRIKANEILYCVKFPKARKNQGLGFSKFGFRKALAISSISSSVFVELDEKNSFKQIRIGSGALARFPVREKELESFLTGKVLDEKTTAEAAELFKEILIKRLAGRPLVELEFKPEAVKGVFKEALNKALACIK